jgi:hypothetical protein
MNVRLRLSFSERSAGYRISKTGIGVNNILIKQNFIVISGLDILRVSKVWLFFRYVMDI